MKMNNFLDKNKLIINILFISLNIFISLICTYYTYEKWWKWKAFYNTFYKIRYVTTGILYHSMKRGIKTIPWVTSDTYRIKEITVIENYVRQYLFH